MPRKARELTAIEVKRLKDRGAYRVGGVNGLMLKVGATGNRSWILRAMIGGQRRDVGLGAYPDVPLAQARDKARAVHEKIEQGIDPIAERNQARAALIAANRKRLTFRDAAGRKHAAIENEFRNEKHRRDWLSSLERHAFPTLGDMSVAEIELAHVVETLNPIWQSKTETATRVRQRIEAVLAWAIVSGHREPPNPAEWKSNLDQVLPAPRKIKKTAHQRALPWADVPAFMADLRQRQGMAARALEFAILTAARSGEVRMMTWAEVDLAARVWTVPANRVKAGKEHQVPLADDALALLEAQPRFEGSEFVFPASRGGALSDMSLSAVTKRMGADAVPHGFRSSFKDWARNATGAPDEVSELALAHVNSDATRAAYARDELLPARARMMRQWAEYCRNGGEAATVTHIGEVRV